jgi:acyl-CoA hydrolase
MGFTISADVEHDQGMATTMTASEAASLIRPVDTVGFGLGPANPHTLFQALSERVDFEDLVLGGALVLGLFELFGRPGVRYRSGFFGPAERYYASVGAHVELIPAGFRQFGPILEQFCPRVMMVQATVPDERGRVSLGLHHGATREELLRAAKDPDRLLIVETNPRLPWTYGLHGYDHMLEVADIDVLVPGEMDPFELEETPGGAVEEAIAANALELISETATLQTGIGGIPTIVATKLAERPGGAYGVHSEMMTDGLMRLHKAGKVTNAHKGVFDGVSVTTFALGTRELYDWLDHNAEVAFAPVGLMNDPTVIGQNRDLVSINGAIMIDLYGQIVADAVDGRQISGVGGHEDFISGADLSLDDRSLVCLGSVVEVAGERRTRIVPELPAGAVVSTPRHHTGVVVTEHGSADLRGLTVSERARALVEIAHPDFRAELSEAAGRLGPPGARSLL